MSKSSVDWNEFNQPVAGLIRDWEFKEPPSIPSMKGRYTMLIATDVKGHAEQLFDAFHQGGDLSQWTYLGHGPFERISDYIDWLERVTSNSDYRFYTVVDPRRQTSVGLICFTRMRPEHGSIEIAHVHFSNVLKKTRGATEAVYMMLSYVFDKLKYRRCEWKCDSLNEKSKRAALRFGFTLEGVFRQDRVSKNRNRDTAWFSITDKEWPAINKAFEAWLSPSNFDKGGSQLSSLSELRQKAHKSI